MKALIISLALGLIFPTLARADFSEDYGFYSAEVWRDFHEYERHHGPVHGELLILCFPKTSSSRNR